MLIVYSSYVDSARAMNWTCVCIAEDDCRGGFVEITGEKYHHLARVRRVRVGEMLRAALPDGRVLLAAVREITADVLRAEITGEEPARGLSPCRITLYQAVLKGEKMDLVVQKASELGVTTLAPLLARRSIPQWNPAQAADRAERWQRIAESAAEQCERSLPMVVEIPRSLVAPEPTPGRVNLLLHERLGQSLTCIAAEHPDVRDIGLYLGPEGGWDEREVDLLLGAGVTPLHLGERILRAETASLAAVTLAQYLWGDLAGSC